MPARRSFSLKFLCFELTKQVIWTKGSLEEPEFLDETWSFQLVPERLLPSIFAFLSVMTIIKLEQFLVQSLTTTGPWSIPSPLFIIIQLAILGPVFIHTIRRH